MTSSSSSQRPFSVLRGPLAGALQAAPPTDRALDPSGSGHGRPGSGPGWDGGGGQLVPGDGGADAERGGQVRISGESAAMQFRFQEFFQPPRCPGAGDRHEPLEPVPDLESSVTGGIRDGIWHLRRIEDWWFSNRFQALEAITRSPPVSSLARPARAISRADLGARGVLAPFRSSNPP